MGALKDLFNLRHNLFDVIISLTHKQRFKARQKHYNECQGKRHAGGLVRPSVRLEGLVLRAAHHIGDPSIVEVGQLGKSELMP